jgi:hypothetical protein
VTLLSPLLVHRISCRNWNKLFNSSCRPLYVKRTTTLDFVIKGGNDIWNMIKRMYTIALERFFFLHMPYYRDSSGSPLNLQHKHTYHFNYSECCFHCYDTKSGWSDKWPLLLQKYKFSVHDALLEEPSTGNAQNRQNGKPNNLEV